MYIFSVLSFELIFIVKPAIQYKQGAKQGEIYKVITKLDMFLLKSVCMYYPKLTSQLQFFVTSCIEERLLNIYNIFLECHFIIRAAFNPKIGI